MTQTSIYNLLYIHSNSPETLYKNVQNKNFTPNRLTFVVPMALGEILVRL